MDSTTQNPDDIHRLGHYLGLDRGWGYVDISANQSVKLALARWALLRQLHELKTHPDQDPAA